MWGRGLQGESDLGSSHSKSKGPGAGIYSACSRSSVEAHVAGEEREHGGVRKEGSEGSEAGWGQMAQKL